MENTKKMKQEKNKEQTISKAVWRAVSSQNQRINDK